MTAVRFDDSGERLAGRFQVGESRRLDILTCLGKALRQGCKEYSSHAGSVASP